MRIPESAAEAEYIASDFADEVEVCSRLNHPCLVKFLGYTTQPCPTIVQELVLRGSLRNMMARQSFRASKKQVATMGLDVALGMLYLHAWSPPMVHRDLKSPNLLVTKDYRLKITDFGMTRVKALSDEGKTDLMTECGTMMWSAPELLKGAVYNEKIDQYAFSMVLLELLTSALPWAIPDESGRVGEGFWVVRKVTSGERPPVPAHADPVIRTLVEECYDGDPDKRPAFKDVARRLALLCVDHSYPLPDGCGLSGFAPASIGTEMAL